MFLLYEANTVYLKAFAQRTLEEVKSEYHDMEIGEFRQISPGYLIQRIQ